MGLPSVGDVVIIPFPYSDLTKFKRRPALILAEVGRGDFLLCQIGFKLFTGNEALILGVAGHLTHSKLSEVIGQLVEMLSACLRDDTF